MNRGTALCSGRPQNITDFLVCHVNSCLARCYQDFHFLAFKRAADSPCYTPTFRWNRPLNACLNFASAP